MNSGELSQRTNHWYVTADGGDAAVRVFPGMSLGESEAGELSLEGGDALLSLSIGNDDSLVVFAVNGGELESEDGEFSGKRHVAFDSAAQIRLPNNNLRFDKGILSETGTGAPLLPSAVWRTAIAENLTAATGSIDTAQPAPATEHAPATESPPAPANEEPESIAVSTERPMRQKVPGKTPRSDKKRQRAIVASASAALACVLIGLIYAGMRTDVKPEPPAPVARQAPVEEAVEEEVPTVALPSRDPIASVATPATAEPEKSLVIAAPSNELMADDIALAETLAAAKPLPQNRPTPEVIEPVAPRNPVNRREVAVAEAEQEEAEVDLAPAAVVDVETQTAEADLRREQEQAQTALVMYERDLLAAKLALAQGRLTQPPEDNAFTLYKQLVASNPESSEARSGFQALGAALVNRAFAELAAKRWSDAQATLTAAAEAGASPNLVADLSGEVAYQQRIADAAAGRFATLYPETELVALNRTTPRLRRYAPDGFDMVQIEFTVSIAGNVQDIEVLGAPPQQLERVVRQAVTDWRFEPVLSGTRPIPVRTRVGLEIP